MILSKTSQYALRTLIYLAKSSNTRGRKISIQEVTNKTSAPQAFTARIINKLAKSGLIDSIKGPGGGITANKKTLEVTLNDIIILFDGKDYCCQCLLGLEQCNAKNPCPIHFEYALAREELLKMVTQVTVEHLAKNLDNTGIAYRLGLAG